MIYFSGYIRHKRHAHLVAVLFAFALCAGVSSAVFYFTSKKMEAGLKAMHLDIYLLIACVLFMVPAVLFVFTKRFKITIAQKETDGSLFIEVKDPALPSPLVITDPITITKQWNIVDLGRRNKIKMLYVTICDIQEKPLVTFTGALGNFYDAPEGFTNTPPNQLKKADLVYDSSNIQDIAYALWCHEDYLSLKKKQ